MNKKEEHIGSFKIDTIHKHSEKKKKNYYKINDKWKNSNNRRNIDQKQKKEKQKTFAKPQPKKPGAK